MGGAQQAAAAAERASLAPGSPRTLPRQPRIPPPPPHRPHKVSFQLGGPAAAVSDTPPPQTPEPQREEGRAPLSPAGKVAGGGGGERRPLCRRLDPHSRPAKGGKRHLGRQTPALRRTGATAAPPAPGRAAPPPPRSVSAPRRPSTALRSPQHHQLPVLDGLLVGRAVLLLAGGKHGAAAKAATAAAAAATIPPTPRTARPERPPRCAPH